MPSYYPKITLNDNTSVHSDQQLCPGLVYMTAENSQVKIINLLGYQNGVRKYHSQLIADGYGPEWNKFTKT